MAKLTVCVSIILVMLVVLSESSSMMRLCCTQYQDKPVPVKVLKYYRIQDTSYCNLKAVIFKTLRNKIFCANPDSEWVQKAMESVHKNIKTLSST